MSAEVARVLRDAADLLERDGWCRGHHEDEHGRHCIAGAVLAVSGLDWVQTTGILPQLANQLGVDFLPAWNDRQEGPEPVIAALRSAADEVDES